MRTLRNILFGIIYMFIYSFFAVMSTGGGHGNFFLLVPLTTFILVLIALFLLTRLENFIARIIFVELMVTHYLCTLIICLSIKENIIEDLNRVAGRENILITSGFYFLGQLIIWLVYLMSIKNKETLK